MEVVIYLDSDYSENRTIWVDRELSKDEITKIVNERFQTWYSYDIFKD